MPDQTGRFEWIRKISVVLLVTVLARLTLAVVYSAFGLVQTAQNTTPDEWWKVLPWAIAILVELATMVWAGVMFGVLRVILSIHDNTASTRADGAAGDAAGGPV